MGAAHVWLKATTSLAHAKVDAAFSHFSLVDAESYRTFLTAHAIALLPIEAWFVEKTANVSAEWPSQSRADALRSDLLRLGATAPAGPAFEATDDPASLAGIVYVLEGSRIGGNILAKRVGGGLPCAYLSSASDAPRWRGLQARLDLIVHDAPTRAAAAASALSVFDQFEQAARLVARPDGDPAGHAH